MSNVKLLSSYPSASLVPVHVVSPSDRGPRGPHGPHGLHGHGPHGHGHHDHPPADGQPFKSEKVTKVKHVSIQPVICRYKTEQNGRYIPLCLHLFFKIHFKRGSFWNHQVLPSGDPSRVPSPRKAARVPKNNQGCLVDDPSTEVSSVALDVRVATYSLYLCHTCIIM